MSTGPWLDVSELARAGAAWRGVLPLDAFERLKAAVSTAGDVDVALKFSADDVGQARVTGTCGVLAQVVCARCSCAVEVRVESAIDFRIVESEAHAQALTPMFDTVVTEADIVAAGTLVEDDLLLSLPEFACEDWDNCPNALELRTIALELRESQAAHEPEPTTSPFAGLRALNLADSE